jgi:hypothetical protein
MLIEILVFAALAQGQPDVAVDYSPEWRRAPAPHTPTGAKDMKVWRGEVVVSCTADPEGRLEDCVAESENPPGFDFARETLVSTRIARLDTRAEGFVPGGQVRFTARFSPYRGPSIRSAAED